MSRYLDRLLYDPNHNPPAPRPRARFCEADDCPNPVRNFTSLCDEHHAEADRLELLRDAAAVHRGEMRRGK